MCIDQVTWDIVINFAEEVTVVTGTQYINVVGKTSAPQNFPNSEYDRDGTTYVFIFENIAAEGAVEVEFTGYDPHPDSWITVN